jgi:hypothetical protein
MNHLSSSSCCAFESVLGWNSESIHFCAIASYSSCAAVRPIAMTSAAVRRPAPPKRTARLTAPNCFLLLTKTTPSATRLCPSNRYRVVRLASGRRCSRPSGEASGKSLLKRTRNVTRGEPTPCESVFFGAAILTRLLGLTQPQRKTMNKQTAEIATAKS